MPKLENFTNRVEIDGIPYPKNSLMDTNPQPDLVGVKYNKAADQIQAVPEKFNPVIFSEWTDSGDTPYASAAALIADMRTFFFSIANGADHLSIQVDSTTEFTQTPPVAAVVYDTGYDPTGKASTERIGVNLLVSAGGIQRGVFDSVRASSLIAFPNVRIARTTEFTGVAGDVSMEFWFDTITTPGAPTVKTLIEVDGGGKTLDSLIAVSSVETIVSV